MFEIFQQRFYRSSDLVREIEEGHGPPSKDLGNGLTSCLGHAIIVFLRRL